MASARDITDAASGRGSSRGPSVKKVMAELDTSQRKLTNMKAAAQRAKANAGKAGMSMLHTAETLGTATVLSGVSGLVPAKHRKWVRGGRVVGALLTGGYGLIRTLNGKNGCHATAIANGMAASELSETAFAFANTWTAKKGMYGKSMSSDGNVIGDAGAYVPEVALTPETPQLADIGIEEVYPDDPILAAFRREGLAAARG